MKICQFSSDSNYYILFQYSRHNILLVCSIYRSISANFESRGYQYLFTYTLRSLIQGEALIKGETEIFV